MHEMSLAADILRLVEQSQSRERFARVTRLRLHAGALAGVELHALRFALESMAPGTVLDGAQLDIEEIPGRALCMGCGASVPIRSRTDACPSCGSVRLTPTGGMELQVHDLIVSDAQGER